MKIIVISKNNYLSDIIARYINFASVELVNEEEYDTNKIEADLIISDEINHIVSENQDAIILVTNEIPTNNKIHYVRKPVRINKLFELINIYYKKFSSLSENIILIEGNKLNLNKKRFYEISGREIILTQKEIDLIYFLYKNFDKKFKKSEILEQVWGYSSKISSHTFETHLYRLRQKLNIIPSIIINDEYGRYFINSLLIK